MLTSVRSYIPHPDGNYGVNSIKLILGSMTLYFSYNVLVAFEKEPYGMVISTNVWSRTTGRQIAYLRGHHPEAKVVLHKEFENLVENELFL